MSRSIPASAYVEHFDPDLAHHRAWLLAVLERLVTHDPQALEEGGTLRRLWTEHKQSASGAGRQASRTDPLQTKHIHQPNPGWLGGTSSRGSPVESGHPKAATPTASITYAEARDWPSDLYTVK